MPPFIVYALPRSRTFWLSRFLSYRDWNCGHDEIRHFRALDDAKSWLSQECTGTVETGAAPWWRLVQKYRPDIRAVVIRRPVHDVVESLARFGFDPDVMTRAMTRLDRKLDQIERRVPGVLSVSFDELATEEGCARVFEHCLPHAFDFEWWATLAPINLQFSMSSLVRYAVAHEPQMRKLAKIAKQKTIAGMQRVVIPPEGMTIQQEPFETFFRDGASLFAEHLCQVDEAPDAYLSKNIDLMRDLDRLGAMHITTARCNGRMFGYLMTVLCPSLEVPGRLCATHTTFFASKDARGLGMKLQRASIEALRARGIDELHSRAGARGSGPKMGPMHRRLGFEDHGQMFRLSLKDEA